MGINQILKKFMPYDIYERHKAVELLFRGKAIRSVLDVGGLADTLVRFTHGATVVALNVDDTGNVVYEGRSFPFATGAFDMVVSLDTLEHVPRNQRRSFILECLRVARIHLLIAAPYGSAEHLACESRLDDLHYDIRGSRNRWLHEHVAHGLPTGEDLVEFQGVLADHGFSAMVWYAGDFEWQCRILEKHLLWTERLGTFRILGQLYLLIASSSLWRRVEFRETPYPEVNRFYLVAERDYQ